MAATLSLTARVLVANDHVPTLLLRDHLNGLLATGDVTGRSGLGPRATPDGSTAGLELASWLPLPDWREPDAGWEGALYDVVIIDCYDEMIRPAALPGPGDALRAGRWLREQTRRTETVLVLTSRTPTRHTAAAAEDGLVDVRSVFDDICDLRIDIGDHGDAASSAYRDPRADTGQLYWCQARGRGAAIGILRPGEWGARG